MNLYQSQFRAMGSPCQVQVFSESLSQAQQGFDAVQAAVVRLESKYSRYSADTLTSRLNASAGSGEWTPLDAETQALCEMAKQAYELSDGLFDVTAGVLRKAWDFKSGHLAEQAQIDALLPLVGWEKVEWRRMDTSVSRVACETALSVEQAESASGWSMRLPHAGMELDFGGIVKEYAADAAASTLMALGFQQALVDLGGDLRIVGPQPSGAGWRVGVRNPRKPTQALSVISLKQGGVATSGDYERYIKHNGKRYCHILNPKTGWPVSGLSSVTVIAEPCVVAGVASTVALLKGVSEGLAWLRGLNIPFLAITEDGEIVTEQAKIFSPETG